MKHICLILLACMSLASATVRAQSSSQDCMSSQPTVWAKAANEEFRYTADVGNGCIAYRFHNAPSGVLTKIKLFDSKANRYVIEKFSLAKCGHEEECEAQTAALIAFVGSSGPSEARLSYGGILGEAHKETITIPVRSDLPPEPQSIQQKVWSRIVGWFGTPSGQGIKLDVTLLQEYSPSNQVITYELYSSSPDAFPVAYTGSSGTQPYSAVWMDRLPGEEALSLEKFGSFGDKPQLITNTAALRASVPAKEWAFFADEIALNYWNESTGESEEFLKFPVVLIQPR